VPRGTGPIFDEFVLQREFQALVQVEKFADEPRTVSAFRAPLN
jgi:hypothetical protein